MCMLRSDSCNCASSLPQLGPPEAGLGGGTCQSLEAEVPAARQGEARHVGRGAHQTLAGDALHAATSAAVTDDAFRTAETAAPRDCISCRLRWQCRRAEGNFPLVS